MENESIEWRPDGIVCNITMDAEGKAWLDGVIARLEEGKCHDFVAMYLRSYQRADTELTMLHEIIHLLPPDLVLYREVDGGWICRRCLMVAPFTDKVPHAEGCAVEELQRIKEAL